MINFEYFCLPALYVKDISSDVIHMVETDAHDRLYLDANGNIQYLNLQSGGGTPDDYSFVLDEDGHNQNNLPFSKKEQELYGLDEEDAEGNHLLMKYEIRECGVWPNYFKVLDDEQESGKTDE